MEVGNFLDDHASELVDQLIGQFIELPPKGGNKETSTTTSTTTRSTTTTEEYDYDDYTDPDAIFDSRIYFALFKKL